MGTGDSDEHSLDGLMPGHRSLETLIPDRSDTPQRYGRRVQEWVLLRGRRESVAMALLLVVLTVLLLAAAIWPWNLQSLLQDTNTVQTLFSALLSGSILLVSIVVSINSIVLSEEITDIEHQRERIDASIEYRGQIEEFIDSEVSPARPAQFLRAILKIIDSQADTLTTIAERSDDDEFVEEARTFSEEVTKEAEKAGDTLSNARFGTFTVLLAGLNYDYSWQLHVARRFESKYGHCLDDRQQGAIEDLVETLKVFATGREYFKSLYYKREFARLSSRLLYVSLPTIVYTSYVLLALDANLFPEVGLFGLSSLTAFVSFSYTVALAPYVILTSYVIRAMAVTLRTLASGPFVLQPGAELDEFDWDESVEVATDDLPTMDRSDADEQHADEQRADD